MTPDITTPIRDWLPVAVYAGHRTGLPDVILGRWPEAIARLNGQPYKSWICETPSELREVQRRLALPCPITGAALDFRRGPDGALAAKARGMPPRDGIVVALYPAPDEGWPWLVLMSQPVAPPGLERGCYSWETLDSKAAAMHHLTRLATLARDRGMTGRDITILRPEPRQ